MYMTAGGNTDTVDKAKKYIINGIVGVIIIALAFAMSTFVLEQIGSAVGGG